MNFIIVLLFISAPIFADPIHFAAQRGRLSQLKGFIEHKNEKKRISVDFPLKETGETPLILAAGSNEPKIAVIKYLIEKGADVNAATSDGWTALMSAAQRNFTNNISVLLANGASPHQITKFGENAFIIALRYRSLDAARLLLEQAPDLAWLADSNGTTPLMHAVQNSNPEIVEFLIEAKAPLNTVDSNGYTAVMRISINGPLAALNTLLLAGADPNIATKEGWTALMEAAVKNRPDAAIILLQAGANPNAKDRFGRTMKSLIPTNPQQDNSTPAPWAHPLWDEALQMAAAYTN